eukprot:522579-Rhodomonas_salina.8
MSGTDAGYAATRPRAKPDCHGAALLANTNARFSVIRRESTSPPSTLLRARYAMSGTEKVYAAIRRRVWRRGEEDASNAAMRGYAISGTDAMYGVSVPAVSLTTRCAISSAGSANGTIC